MKIQRTKFILILISIGLLMVGCQSAWQIKVTSPEGLITIFDQKVLEPMFGLWEDLDHAVRLEQYLYQEGFHLIDEVILTLDNNKMISFQWEEIAKNSIITAGGELVIQGKAYRPDSIKIVPSTLTNQIKLSILDLAPTMAKALGLSEFPNAIGEVQYQTSAKYGVLILVDGLQYEKLHEIMAEKTMPFFNSSTQINKGFTVYPPMTTAASAALLTGNPPALNGVMGYGIRSTNLPTLFDLVVDQGKTVIAVEGYALPFSLRSAEVVLSYDLNYDGFTDDEVLENSLDVISKNMPDLLYIHFHDVDDMGHSYGPDSMQYQDAIIRIDQYLSLVFDSLPNNTFVIIFSDHGMHALENGGTHGNLIESDLVIPILFLEKK